MTDCFPTGIPPERWKSIDNRAMRRGQFTICMYGEPPEEEFALFGAGPEMLAHGKTYREMMEKADELSRGKQ